MKITHNFLITLRNDNLMIDILEFWKSNMDILQANIALMSDISFIHFCLQETLITSFT